MDSLPPHLKHKIISLDPKLLSAAYGDGQEKADNNNPVTPLVPVKNKDQLIKFKEESLSTLQNEGYLVLEGFMGRDFLLNCKVLLFAQFFH